MHWHYYINIMSIIYSIIVYSVYAIDKWSTILNITYLLAALFAAFCAAVFLTIVPLASIYVSL